MATLRQELSEKRIVWIDDFLSPKACAAICEELDYTLWRPSMVVYRALNGRSVTRESAVRVSETAMEPWFGDPLKTIMARIDRRLVRMLGAPKSRYECWQALRYGKGGKFDYHLDSGHWRRADEPERQTTVLIYLNTPKRGGGTRFRELDLDIEARTGRLVVWENLRPDGESDPDMLHCSTPLRQGRKYALVTWIRRQRGGAAECNVMEHGRVFGREAAKIKQGLKLK